MTSEERDILMNLSRDDFGRLMSAKGILRICEALLAEEARQTSDLDLSNHIDEIQGVIAQYLTDFDGDVARFMQRTAENEGGYRDENAEHRYPTGYLCRRAV